MSSSSLPQLDFGHNQQKSHFCLVWLALNQEQKKTWSPTWIIAHMPFFQLLPLSIIFALLLFFLFDYPFWLSWKSWIFIWLRLDICIIFFVAPFILFLFHLFVISEPDTGVYSRGIFYAYFVLVKQPLIVSLTGLFIYFFSSFVQMTNTIVNHSD